MSSSARCKLCNKILRVLICQAAGKGCALEWQETDIRCRMDSFPCQSRPEALGAQRDTRRRPSSSLLRTHFMQGLALRTLNKLKIKGWGKAGSEVASKVELCFCHQHSHSSSVCFPREFVVNRASVPLIKSVLRAAWGWVSYLDASTDWAPANKRTLAAGHPYSFSY